MAGLDLIVGQTARRSMHVTPETVKGYADLTGDYNPLHFEESYAAGTPFLSQNWSFTAPVFAEDMITATAEVLTVHEHKPVCSLRVQVTRADSEVVLEGEAWCYRFSPNEG